MVGFYLRVQVRVPAFNPAAEVSSATNVFQNADILYRNVYADFDREVDNLDYFSTNIHSEGLNRPEDLPNARVFMLQSIGWVYEKWGEQLAEHMFIIGIKGPGGRITASHNP